MLQGFFQIALTLLLVVAISPILGGYVAQVFMTERTFLDPIMTPVERVIYRLSGVEPEAEMTGWQYAIALLISNCAIAILVFFLLIFQEWLPL